MKPLIFYADAHVDSYQEFNEQGYRLARCLDALRQVWRYAEQVDAEAVIGLGDLLEQKDKIAFSTYNAVSRAFDEAFSIPRYELAGNHNLIDYLSGETNLVPLSSNLNVINRPGVVEFSGTVLAFLPYFKNLDDFYDALDSLKNQTAGCKKPVILCAHQELDGAVTGTHRYVAAGGVDLDHVFERAPFSLAVFGHYHKHQVFLDGNGRMRAMYLGALLQQEFGEEGNPQVFWHYDQRGQTWSPVTVVADEFITVHANSVLDVMNLPRTAMKRVYVEQDVAEQARASLERARIVPVAEQEKSQRLQASDFSNLSSLIKAYVAQKVPREKQEDVITEVREMLTEAKRAF